MNTRCPVVKPASAFADLGDRPDHFMTGDAHRARRIHAVVAVENAQIGAANAGAHDLHQ